MNGIGSYFVGVGLLIFFWTWLTSIGDETIMQQIYHQVCYLTSFVVAGMGYILIALNCLKEAKRNVNANVEEEVKRNGLTGL